MQGQKREQKINAAARGSSAIACVVEARQWYGCDVAAAAVANPADAAVLAPEAVIGGARPHLFTYNQ